MTQTAEIDIFTHRLSTRHVTELIIAAVNEGAETISLIVAKDQLSTIVQQIRVEMSRIYTINETPAQDRFGLRFSEPFAWSIQRDAEVMRCQSITVRPYHSPQKMLRRAIAHIKLPELKEHA